MSLEQEFPPRLLSFLANDMRIRRRNAPLRPSLLSVLSLLVLFSLPISSIGQESCHINALVSERIALFAPGCPIVTPHGGRCRLDSAICDDTRFGMVLEALCVDSEWHWPDDPEFCAFWQGCVFTPPYELHCTGSGGSNSSQGQGPGRLPNRMDPRLTIVSANFLNINRHKKTTRLPQIQHLNLSHNIITELTPLALQQASLRVLDLSFNAITSISSAHLPTSGTLDQLYLKGNNIQVYSPLALDSAMSRCQSTELNETDAVASFNMALEAPGCELYLNIGVGQGSPDQVYCIVPRCNSTLQTVSFKACDQEVVVSGEYYELRSRCDSISDCATGEDEMGCQGTMQLEELRGEAGFGACHLIEAYFGLSYTIRFGVAIIPLTDLGRSAISVDALTFTLDEAQPPLGDIFSSTLVNAAFTEDRLVVSANYSLTSAPDVSLMCSVNYLLNPMQNSSTSTPVLWTTPQGPTVAAQELDGTGTLAAVIGGAAGALVLIVSLGYMLLRRRRARLHKHRLDHLAPLIPESLKAQVQEQFNLQFGSILSAAIGHNQDTHSQHLVSLEDIQITDRCLGQGFSGTVYVARLRHQPGERHSSASWPNAGASGGTMVALKVIAWANGNDQGGCGSSEAAIRCALLEARLHARLEHPNLVRLLAVQETRQPVMIALELCEHGALLGVLREQAGSEPDFSGEQRRDMATQIAAGLRYLHSKLCIHRDITARNVLVAGAPPSALPPVCGYIMKLSDLGLARQLRTEEDYYKTKGDDDAMPIRWQCPEAMLTRVYTAKSDVYSFGVLLYEIYSGGATPFANLQTSEVVCMVKAGARLARPAVSMDEDVFALMRACTAADVGGRPSATTLHAQLSGTWTLNGDGGIAVQDKYGQDARGLDENHFEASDGCETAL